MTKRLLRESQQTLDTVLELSSSMQALAHTTQDHREAVRAMMERRAGTYTGA